MPTREHVKFDVGYVCSAPGKPKQAISLGS